MGWFLGILFTFMIAIPGGLLIYQTVYYERVCETDWVKSIGGCDRYGDCGVRLESGRFYEAKKPVVGMAVEVCVLKPR